MIPSVVWSSVALPLVLILLVYRRARHMVGRQPVRPGRIGARVALIALLLVALAILNYWGGWPWFQALSKYSGGRSWLEALAWGLGVGLTLGVLGVRLTRVESTAEGDYYTPNLWLGLSLTALLVCRLAYRYMAISSSRAAEPVATIGAQPLSHHPHPLWTMAIMGVVLGYYLSYYVGLLVLHRRHMARQRHG